MKKVLIYGAYGYTGKLIVNEALAKDIKPTVAGRNQKAVKELGEQKQLPYLSFSIDDKSALINALKEHDIVIHCAGPFIHTAKQMAEACVETSTHYLDIACNLSNF